MYKIDLNCDLGESYGVYKLGNNEEIFKMITSANIACGFHAGDPSTMRKTVELALKNNVAVGAHPGFPDLAGFGRRNMDLSPQEVYDLMIYQIGALYGFVKAAGGTMQHVKPHGALYNMAAKNAAFAQAIAEAVYQVEPELILFGLAGSEMINAGKKIGLRTASEVFADRTYQIDGSLTPRCEPNAVITKDHEAIAQVIRMVKEGKVLSQQGEDLPIQADTVCIHGDGVHALSFAQKIRETMQSSGIILRRIGIL